MRITTNFVASSALWVIDVTPVSNQVDPKKFGLDLGAAVSEIRAAGGGTAQLWIHDVADEADEVARAAGAEPYRDLWQLRCPLPVAPSTLTTRSFVVGDAENLVAVNNRAFSWHPEQSGMTPDSLAATMSEPWFDPDGLRLFEIDGQLKGFCWTKMHHDMDPVHGEIYVIAVDPSVHGQGFGTPMTLAGLDWISGKGIEHALLYVESDNDPANATYKRIGFRRHRIDRAYNLSIEPGST